jgi:predicted nucleotidyltransferase
MAMTPLLPTGTQVVSRVEIRGAHGRAIHPAGVVGIVTASPADHLHTYTVRFPDGFEAHLARADLVPLREYQAAAAGPEYSPLHEHDLSQHVILRVVIGSRAYGLETETSDTDMRGVYLPPARLHWSLFGVPEQLEDDARQEVFWELQKFLVLALKANPNVLEVLYSPLVVEATPLARELLGMRGTFLSKLVYQTYNGYVQSQFKKLQGDLRNKGAVKWKHVLHLIRLLLAGIAALREGEIPVRVTAHREALLAIRNGAMRWEEIDAWRVALHAEFDRAAVETRLPERPDYDAANAFLLKARRSVVE